MGKSNIYEYRGRKFRYNYDAEAIEHVDRLTPTEVGINEKYRKKYGKPIFETDENRYYVFSEIKMSVEEWENNDIRDKRLDSWCAALDKTEEEFTINHERIEKK